MGLLKMNCEAYSTGWKKAKANNPSDSSAWTLGGGAERAIRLAKFKADGVKVAESYTLPRSGGD